MVDEQQHKTSTLELMLEWMASIYAILGSTESEKGVLLPHIIPVGTHGDDPYVKNKQGEIAYKLYSEYKGKAFEHLHVVLD